MRIVLLPPLYLPPEGYFGAMANADLAVIDTSMRYDKRFKVVRRTQLDNECKQRLTVPVTPGKSGSTYAETCRVSPHGRWWRVHRLTMETLYGPTPWFDLYKSDLFDIISEDAVGRLVADLDIDLILIIRRLKGITTPLSTSLDPRYLTDNDVNIEDLRYHDFYKDSRSCLPTLFNS